MPTAFLESTASTTSTASTASTASTTSTALTASTASAASIASAMSTASAASTASTASTTSTVSNSPLPALYVTPFTPLSTGLVATLTTMDIATIGKVFKPSNKLFSARNIYGILWVHCNPGGTDYDFKEAYSLLEKSKSTITMYKKAGMKLKSDGKLLSFDHVEAMITTMTTCLNEL
ncbi:hypothetical protein FISHEDRAFT_62774 [Fistulina hepatica ATCC 64428]|nr:hypothetical protein FISHEDRAFT_62774 [Fistulina hepatica ATCC 64428]